MDGWASDAILERESPSQVEQHLLEVETEAGEDLVELVHKQNLEAVLHC